ncbi:MAG: hypothetical protein IK053_04985, partial [Muribaculaceae bacterium]|nr:hypothetical protein [Muribaculaceae bacterium]
DPKTGKASAGLFELKRFADDGSVDAVRVDEKSVDIIYDLQGRKVLNSSSLSKGIYVTNGKKFVVR